MEAVSKWLEHIRRMREIARAHSTSVRSGDDVVEATCSCGWQEVVMLPKNTNVEGSAFARRRLYSIANAHWVDAVTERV